MSQKVGPQQTLTLLHVGLLITRPMRHISTVYKLLIYCYGSPERPRQDNTLKKKKSQCSTATHSLSDKKIILR